MPQLVVVGALARVEPARAAEAARRLDALEGVEPFSIGERGRMGLLVEAEDLARAHARLGELPARVPGLLAVWPVSAHVEEPATAARTETQQEENPA